MVNLNVYIIFTTFIRDRERIKLKKEKEKENGTNKSFLERKKERKGGDNRGGEREIVKNLIGPSVVRFLKI